MSTTTKTFDAAELLSAFRTRLLAVAAAGAVATAGLAVAGCDTDDASYGDTDVTEGEPASETLDPIDGTADAGGGFEMTVAEVRAGIEEALNNQRGGDAQEKLGAVLEKGQEVFDELGEQANTDTVADFFGDLNERFDAFQASLGEDDPQQSMQYIQQLRELQVPAAAQPYVQPFMDEITRLGQELGTGAVGDAARGAMDRLTGGNGADDVDAEGGSESFDRPE